MALEVSFPALLAVLECVNLRKNIVWQEHVIEDLSNSWLSESTETE